MLKPKENPIERVWLRGFKRPLRKGIHRQFKQSVLFLQKKSCARDLRVMRWREREN
jgi:hypothetical protein